MVLKGVILDTFDFGRMWWSWKNWFGIIGWFCFVKSLPIELPVVSCLSVYYCACRLSYRSELLADLANAKSASAVGLHHYHCQCWHQCLLYTTLITLLMQLSSYVTYILINFPHWCKLSNLGMWHKFGVRGAYLLPVLIWQEHGKLKLHFVDKYFYDTCTIN